MKTWIYLALMMSLNLNSAQAADKEGSAEKIVKAATKAFRAGKTDEAMELMAKAVKAEPENLSIHYFKGQLHGELRQYAKAAAAYTKVLELKPANDRAAVTHQDRGLAYFKLGKIKESIEDFDVFIKADPRRDPYHWQRGISYYYANEFKKGYEQFERHQTVNRNDVENAVWHFLCLARAKGIKEAKAKLIPIVGDGRVPMMEVLALFGGKSTPAKVLANARARGVKGARLERQLFYAHLYLGIWYETTGELKLRDKYIGLAAVVADEHGYMGDVARVHAVLNKIKIPKLKK